MEKVQVVEVQHATGTVIGGVILARDEQNIERRR